MQIANKTARLSGAQTRERLRGDDVSGARIELQRVTVLRLTAITSIDREFNGLGAGVGKRERYRAPTVDVCRGDIQQLVELQVIRRDRGSLINRSQRSGIESRGDGSYLCLHGGRRWARRAPAPCRRLLAEAAIDEIADLRIREHGCRGDDDHERDRAPDTEYVVPVEIACFAACGLRVEPEPDFEHRPVEDIPLKTRNRNATLLAPVIARQGGRSSPVALKYRCQPVMFEKKPRMPGAPMPSASPV
jgi:hypothetical protein